MTDEVVDDPLVDALRGEIANEAVPQAVPTLDLLPLAVLQGSCEVTVGLIGRQSWVRLFDPAAGDSST